MIIVLKKERGRKKKVEELKESLIRRGLRLHMSQGLDTMLIGLIGDTTELQEDQFQALEIVESVKRIKEPYKKANRSMHRRILWSMCAKERSAAEIFSDRRALLCGDQGTDDQSG